MPRKVSLIVAYGPDGVIGRSGGLPWPRHAEDMRRFRERTLGKAVIMGRKTWEGLNSRGLDYRHNIVVTSQKDKVDRNLADVARDVEHALALAGNDDLFIIGGARTFISALPYTNHYLITEMEKKWPGDVYFKVPFLSAKRLISREEWKDVNPDLNCVFSEYEG